MSDLDLRRAVVTATGGVISPLPESAELVKLVLCLAREHGDLQIALATERERSKGLKRQIAEMQEKLREYSNVESV